MENQLKKFRAEMNGPSVCFRSVDNCILIVA